MIKKTYTGINIQYPISQLIISGRKTIETRTYAIPAKYLGQEMLMIETPGKTGKFKSRAVAIVRFDNCFLYENSRAFYNDIHRHCVDNNSMWSWSDDKPKWAWEIKLVRRFKPKSVAKRLGIKFTLNLSL